MILVLTDAAEKRRKRKPVARFEGGVSRPFLSLSGLVMFGHAIEIGLWVAAPIMNSY